MLTETAKLDLAALRAAGFAPTDEEIIRLNDLAVRIERGANTTPANMPRIGFAGNVVLHEPTIGALEWWNRYGADAAWTNGGRMETYFFMLAHARRVGYLDTLTTGKQIRAAVKQWKRGIDATEAEMWRALMWVKYGAGEPDAERQIKVADSIDGEAAMDALWAEVIAAAGAMGVAPESLRTCTQSSLVSTIVQCNLRAHVPMKQSVAKDYISYRQLLRKIEERGKA